MNTGRILLTFALCIVVCSCSFINNAAAYSSTDASSTSIETVIKEPTPVISDSGDIAVYSTLTPSDSDDNTYKFVEDNSGSYPATYIVESDATDKNIVGSGEDFDLTVTIPAGVTFCFKIAVVKYLVGNTITVGWSLSDDTIEISQTKTNYIGADTNGKLTSGSSADNVWMTTTEEVQVHLEGSRSSTSVFGYKINAGSLQVELLMQKTGSA